MISGKHANNYVGSKPSIILCGYLGSMFNINHGLHIEFPYLLKNVSPPMKTDGAETSYEVGVGCKSSEQSVRGYSLT